MKRTGRFAGIAVIAALSLFASACGSNDNGGAIKSKVTTTSRPSTAGAGSLKSRLPAAIASAGVLKVGSDIEYPPNESYEGGDTSKPIGMDIDLVTAMGEKLGVTVQFINDTDFAGIIGALQAGRFDIIVSSMNDNADRRGKGVDFVDYFTAGVSMLVAKGNPKHVKTLDDLCGQIVAVQKGTTEETESLPAQQTKCKAANKGAINVLSFEKDTDALAQVKTGRAVAVLEDSPVAGYNAKTSGNGNDFEVTGERTDSANYGIAVPKTNEQLRNAIQSALQAIIADGTYDKILAKWGNTTGALKTAPINGG
jgi:polar amino acid transport system substrate-binding protein